MSAKEEEKAYYRINEPDAKDGEETNTEMTTGKKRSKKKFYVILACILFIAAAVAILLLVLFLVVSTSIFHNLEMKGILNNL